MQTASQRPALGRYSHVRMISPPLWLPIRRAPRSNSGRAKASGLAYERATIAALRLAFANCTNFSCIFHLIHNVLNPSRANSKQIQIGAPELIAGQWFEYQKNNIRHLCQPDLLIIFPSTNHPVDPIPSGNVPTNHLLPNHLVEITSGNPNHLPTSGNFLNKKIGGSNLIPPPSAALIICCEIKLTYTPSAIKKLNRLYLPLVDSIFHPHILLPLIICKNLTPLSPIHSFSLSSVLSLPIPLLYFPSGNFRI